MNPLMREFYRPEPKYLYESVMATVILLALFFVAAFHDLTTAAMAFGVAAAVLESVTLYRMATDTILRKGRRK